MRTLKFTIAYDGTAYAGWQCQPDRISVQETLENAMARITGERNRTLASGRTDAGVHALGQVVAMRTESTLSVETMRRALNANLPDDIAVLDAVEAPDDFHAISHVRRKRYRYVIDDGPVRDVFTRHYAWHYDRGRLDAEAMRLASAALWGTHDFSSFESSGAPRATSVRTVFELLVERDGDRITIEIEADGFLYNMVRAIVGTLVEVGRGRRSESWPGEVLAARDRAAAGPTAPPQGLFLVRVEYRPVAPD